LAYLLHPTPWTPPLPLYAELQQRLAQRDSLLELRQQVRTQLHARNQMPTIIATGRMRMEQLIEILTTPLVAVDAELEAALELDPSWAASAQRRQTITGIGPLVAAWLLVTTLNFTLCESAEALTAYAGLAPHPYQSGTRVHGRACIGHTGNARLRTILYLSTRSAAQHTPVIKSSPRAVDSILRAKQPFFCLQSGVVLCDHASVGLSRLT
jgi:transposase